MAIKFRRVVLRQRRGDDDIKRLETVGCVRGKQRQEDSMAVAKLDKCARYVAAVAVKDEETVIASCFRSREALEYIREPGQSNLIVSPAGD